MKTWVIIPAYNEAERLSTLLEKIKQKDVSILVVDDGSTDNTHQIAQDKASIVLVNQRNSGKGVSLRRAILFLLANVEFDYVITMDADSQHSPDDIDKFVKETSMGAEFVIGNRMSNPSGMPIIRIITNKVMSFMLSKAAKQKIPDSQCGFRLIKKEVLEKVKIETNKFEVESETIIKAARLGFQIKSIPIKTIYFPDNKSKINPLFDTFRFMRFIRRIKK